MLPRRVVLNCLARTCCINAAVTARGMQQIGLAFVLAPAFNRLYPESSARARAFARYGGHSNTHVFMVPLYVGIVLALEEQIARGSLPEGAVGVVRRDPMAMLPFCGYHMGDYWQHWLDMGKKIPKPPKIFNVNWFRTDEDGNFAWPGFGDNMRVLQWIISRADDEIGAAETALGYEPNTHDIDMEGLEMSMYDMRRLLSVDRDLWLQECEDAREYYEKIGKVPPELYEELDALEMRLNRGYKVKHE